MEFVCGYSGSCFHKVDFESDVHEEWVTKEKIIRNPNNRIQTPCPGIRNT